MKIVDIAQSRYSTKIFDAHRPLTCSQFAELKQLLRLSPSSVNSQPWHFILTQSDLGKARIAKRPKSRWAESRIFTEI